MAGIITLHIMVTSARATSRGRLNSTIAVESTPPQYCCGAWQCHAVTVRTTCFPSQSPLKQHASITVSTAAIAFCCFSTQMASTTTTMLSSGHTSAKLPDYLLKCVTHFMHVTSSQQDLDPKPFINSHNVCFINNPTLASVPVCRLMIQCCCGSASSLQSAADQRAHLFTQARNSCMSLRPLWPVPEQLQRLRHGGNGPGSFKRGVLTQRGDLLVDGCPTVQTILKATCA